MPRLPDPQKKPVVSIEIETTGSDIKWNGDLLQTTAPG